MKKLFITVASLFMASLICFSVSATSIQSARGVVCPICDHNSVVTVRISTEGPHTEYKSCSHGKLGYDEYSFSYYVYQVKCSSSTCTYAEAPYSKKSASTFIACHGVQ